MACVNSSCETTTTGVAPQIFHTALNFFAASQCLNSEGTLPEVNICDSEEFDFIIVGAGSAGCVLANRLSEVEKWKILLIEAGGEAPIESLIPYFCNSLMNTKVDWNYTTAYNGITNQANINNSINWPRGKMIGGCSGSNGMFYTKGCDQDYENWELAGNVDWDVNNVRRCYRKMENLQDTNLLKIQNVYDYYGHDGPLVINTFNLTYEETANFVLKSWDEIGFKTVSDLNTAQLRGSGFSRANAANGERWSSSRAYLYPVINRNNLKVIYNSLVTKILVRNISKKAYGVQIERNGKIFKLLARKEVIISAGAINSPQLLMLSGIGPKRDLVSNNIRSIHDSPMVGRNLQDHTFIHIPIVRKKVIEKDDPNKKYLEAIQYLYNRTGYLAAPPLSNLLAFFSLESNATCPDFEVYFTYMPSNTTVLKNFLEQSRYRKELSDPLLALNKKYSIFMFHVSLLHPYSRGNITLNSNSPEDSPIIYSNYFIDDRDLESTVKALQLASEVVDTKFFKEGDSFLARLNWPPCNGFELGSQEYWRCIAKSIVNTVYHPVGTCMMGPDQQTSVVDGRLRVHGVKNLRVIDASIMPTTVSGNTNGPTMMIGERGSELVKEDNDVPV